MSDFHKPVLLQKTIEYLQVKKGLCYIDATLGGAGHAFEILEHGGKVLGIDVDQDALDYVEKKLKAQSSKLKNEKRITLARGNFRDIDKIALSHGFEKVAGILFDLGVSSHQLEKAERGFSFQKKGPLDMRMDKNLQVRAKDLINALSKGELYEIFHRLGEERRAFAISNNIVRARRIKPIETTDELAKIIEDTYGFRSGTGKGFQKSFANKRIFQALRIAVNDELSALLEALPKALSLLGKNGILIVISFHSLEDRIIKNSFRQFEADGKGRILTKKPIFPSESEISQNRRSKGAKLRVFKN